jgi:hypothetical protein
MMVKVRQGMAITKVINPVLVGACSFFFPIGSVCFGFRTFRRAVSRVVMFNIYNSKY